MTPAEQQKALEKRLPLSGTFELLPYCNMRCSMCYIVHDRPADWKDSLHSVDFWDALLDQAIEQGMLYGLITGGEPLLYPGFRELMERINKKPIHLALKSNGTLLDRETVQWLATVSPGRLNTSLYGGSNETYARLCRNPKGFDQVTRAGGLLYGAALWAIFCPPKEENNKTGKRLICCLAGLAVPVLIAVAAFALAGDLTGMLQGTFLYPACALLSGFDSLQVLLHKGVKCLFLLPFLAGGVLLVMGEKPAKLPGDCVLLSGVFCGLFLLCGDNRWYYYQAALLAVPLGIVLLCPGKGSRRRIAAGGASLLLMLCLCAAPLKSMVSFLRAGVPDVVNEFYEDAQSFEAENPGYRFIALDTDCAYFLLLDKLPEYRYFTDQTELSAYDPAVKEAVDGYLSGEPADILFVTERGYIGRELDKYTLIQVYLEYGGSLFVYLPNE